MKHFAVYDKDTGQLVSTGTVVSEDLPDNLAVTDGWDGAEWEGPDNVPGLQWSPSDRRFIRSSLTVNVTHIAGNGVAFATVTYKTDDPTPPEKVIFKINGSPQSVDVVNKKAEVDVTSNTPGDTITVGVDVDESLVTTIGVENATG